MDTLFHIQIHYTKEGLANSYQLITENLEKSGDSYSVVFSYLDRKIKYFHTTLSVHMDLYISRTVEVKRRLV